VLRFELRRLEVYVLDTIHTARGRRPFPFRFSFTAVAADFTILPSFMVPLKKERKKRNAKVLGQSFDQA
jgi:hypothetical protein